MLELKQKLTTEVNAIEGLKMWEVDVMPMHFHSEKAPTSAVYQGLLDKGWLMLGLVAISGASRTGRSLRPLLLLGIAITLFTLGKAADTVTQSSTT